MFKNTSGTETEKKVPLIFESLIICIRYIQPILLKKIILLYLIENAEDFIEICS